MRNYSIVRLIERTLNYLEPELVNHGKRVAYLTYKALKQLGRYDAEKVYKASLLALLHDIGAYKTEEIGNMVKFETKYIWEHSVYGYLFIKYFSPLFDMASVVLFHHANCREIMHLEPSLREFAQIINIADRFDVLRQTAKSDNETFKAHFDRRRGSLFNSDLVDLFFADGWETLLEGIDNDIEFNNMLYNTDISEDEVFAYIYLIAMIVDFKSPQTATHTISVAHTCNFLSKFFELSNEEGHWLYTAALLHDLGKISIPLKILEKPGRLTDEEMEVMKKHVSITEEILTGNIDDCCVKLAVRHHETLNGKGYPHNLDSGDLTLGQRIVSVGDIISALYDTRSYKESFSKEKIIGILQDMVESGRIDGNVVSVAVENFDPLIIELNKATKPIIDIYEQIQLENTSLLQEVKNFNLEAGTGSIK